MGVGAGLDVVLVYLVVVVWFMFSLGREVFGMRWRDMVIVKLNVKLKGSYKFENGYLLRILFHSVPVLL